MRRHSRRRGQILPLFLMLSLVMLAFAALLIDGAGVILVSQDFNALTSRSAGFAAARYSLACTPVVSDTAISGTGCVLDLARQDTIDGDFNSYVAAWTTGGPERIGIPATITGHSISVDPDGQTIQVTLEGCYEPFLLKIVVALFHGDQTSSGGCPIGDIALVSTASATVMLSN